MKRPKQTKTTENDSSKRRKSMCAGPTLGLYSSALGRRFYPEEISIDPPKCATTTIREWAQRCLLRAPWAVTVTELVARTGADPERIRLILQDMARDGAGEFVAYRNRPQMLRRR
jgi:hypothetical protein